MEQDTVVLDSTGEEAAERPSPDSPGSPLRRVLSALGLLVLAASAVFGGNLFGVRERFLGSETPRPIPAAPSRAASSPATTTAPAQTVLRSAPWWQRVTTLEGTGPITTPAFSVRSGAIQWRLRWSCKSGHLVIHQRDRPRPLVDSPCPGPNMAYATRPGEITLDVKAEGVWQVEVDQQVDVPLNEPPLPSMTAPGSRPVATGSFYRIDQVGSGGLTLYRLPDGAHAIRLDNIYISPNVDLEIHLSALPAPRTTEHYLSAPSAMVARLDVTAGSMNFVLPKEVDPRQYRSLVIWCPPVRSAYAAATLNPVR